MTKYVHISGNCVNCSCLLEVRLGTKISDIVKQLGNFIKEPSLIIVNGDICGTSVKSLDIPVTKSTKSICFKSHRIITDSHIYTCINCGYCRFVCPQKLRPDIIFNNYVNFEKLPKNIKDHVKDCIECHLCNSVCPSRLPLTQIISILIEKND